MQRALDLAVVLVALMLLALGAQWLFTPADFAESMGITLIGDEALSTARGDIGGMFLAGTLLALLGLWRRNAHLLRALALLLGCIALGRCIGFGLDGIAQPSLIAFAAELIMVAILLAKARTLTRVASAAESTTG